MRSEGVRGQELGVRSQELGVWSLEFRVGDFVKVAMKGLAVLCHRGGRGEINALLYYYQAISKATTTVAIRSERLCGRNGCWSKKHY